MLEGRRKRARIRPRRAFGPPTFTQLAVQDGAVRGWILQKRRFAHEILRRNEILPGLQWKSYFFIADSKSKTLTKMEECNSESALQVFDVKTARVSAQGRVHFGNKRFFVAKIKMDHGQPPLHLGFESHDLFLKWLQVLRACTIKHESLVSENNQEDGDKEREEAGSLVAQFPLEVFDGTPLKKELLRFKIVLDHQSRVFTIETFKATVLQCSWRRWTARRELRYRRQQHASTSILQAWIRAYKGRQILKGKKERISSAKCIQRVFRGHKGRRIYQKARIRFHSCRKIQRSFRAFLSRMFVKRMDTFRLERVQDHLCDMLHCLEVHVFFMGSLVKMLKNSSSAVIVQKTVRRWLSRRNFQRIRINRSAITMQSWFRMQKLQKRFLETKTFAATLQRVFKGRALQLGVNEAINRRRCAKKIQAAWRMRNARARYQRVCVFTRNIQLVWKVSLERRRFRTLKFKLRIQHETATFLQNVVPRKLKFYRSWKLVVQTRAAHQIQRWTKRVLSYRHWMIFSHAARRIQRAWRRKIFWCELREQMACRIQRFFRAWLLWKLFMSRKRDLSFSFSCIGRIVARTALLLEDEGACFVSARVMTKSGDILLECSLQREKVRIVVGNLEFVKVLLDSKRNVCRALKALVNAKLRKNRSETLCFEPPKCLSVLLTRRTAWKFWLNNVLCAVKIPISISSKIFEPYEDRNLRVEEELTWSAGPRFVFASTRSAEGLEDRENEFMALLGFEATEKPYFWTPEQEYRVKHAQFRPIFEELEEEIQRCQRSLSQAEMCENDDRTKQTDPALHELACHETQFFQERIKRFSQALNLSGQILEHSTARDTHLSLQREHFQAFKSDSVQLLARSREVRQRCLAKVRNGARSSALFGYLEEKVGLHMGAMISGFKKLEDESGEAIEKIMRGAGDDVIGYGEDLSLLTDVSISAMTRISRMQHSLNTFLNREAEHEFASKTHAQRLEDSLSKCRESLESFTAESEREFLEHRNRFQKRRDAEEDGRRIVERELEQQRLHEEWTLWEQTRAPKEKMMQAEGVLTDILIEGTLVENIRDLSMTIHGKTVLKFRNGFELQQLRDAVGRAESLEGALLDERYLFLSVQSEKIVERLRAATSLLERFPEGATQLRELHEECILEAEQIGEMSALWLDAAKQLGIEPIALHEKNDEAIVMNQPRRGSIFSLNHSDMKHFFRDTLMKTYARHALDFLRDPRKLREARQESSALEIQRVVRGWLCRMRWKHRAASKIQRIFRKRRASESIRRMIVQNTIKLFDRNSGLYYYVFGNRVDWRPPVPIADVYIPFGIRVRTHGYHWLPEEAAVTIQAAFRGYQARRYFMWFAFQCFEKVWEPSQMQWFYQNLLTGRCSFQKPYCFGSYDL